MTLQEAKDQVANELGFYSWDICLASNNISQITKVMNLAAELFAQSQVNEAIETSEGILERYAEGTLPFIDAIEELKRLKR